MTLSPHDIGSRIYKTRKGIYPSRIEFANALQTSEGNIKRIERGLGLPSIDLIVRMSALLGVSIDYLIFGGTPTEEIEKLKIIYLNLSLAGRETLNIFGQELLKLEKKLEQSRL
jgi:transcriptional regulator with XRE-family HTH domain